MFCANEEEADRKRSVQRSRGAAMDETGKAGIMCCCFFLAPVILAQMNELAL